MDGGDLGTVLDATAAGAVGLQAYVAGVVNQAATGAVVVTIALLAVIILTEIFKPAEDGALRPALALAPAGVGAPLPVAAAAQQRQPGGVAVAEREAEPTWEGPLFGSGLSPVDIVALTALRDRVRAEHDKDGPTAEQRLAFARWLAEHGRLGS
jgi:hypothetical protein